MASSLLAQDPGTFEGENSPPSLLYAAAHFYFVAGNEEISKGVDGNTDDSSYKQCFATDYKATKTAKVAELLFEFANAVPKGEEIPKVAAHAIYIHQIRSSNPDELKENKKDMEEFLHCFDSFKDIIMVNQTATDHLISLLCHLDVTRIVEKEENKLQNFLTTLEAAGRWTNHLEALKKFKTNAITIVEGSATSSTTMKDEIKELEGALEDFQESIYIILRLVHAVEARKGQDDNATTLFDLACIKKGSYRSPPGQTYNDVTDHESPCGFDTSHSYGHGDFDESIGQDMESSPSSEFEGILLAGPPRKKPRRRDAPKKPRRSRGSTFSDEQDSMIQRYVNKQTRVWDEQKVPFRKRQFQWKSLKKINGGELFQNKEPSQIKDRARVLFPELLN